MDIKDNRIDEGKAFDWGLNAILQMLIRTTKKNVSSGFCLSIRRIIREDF